MSDQAASARTRLAAILAARLNLPVQTVCPHTAFVADTFDLSAYLYFGGMQDICSIELADSSPPDEEAYLAYRELIGDPNWRYRVKLVKLAGAPPDLQTRFRQCDNTVVLAEEDCVAMEKAKTVLSPLRQLLRTQLDIAMLSPYQYTGAVTGNRFVGREVQLSSIIRHPEKAYLVTGTRMSGKTSLLMEAQRRLQELDHREGEDDPTVTPKVVYVDCKRFTSVGGLIHGVLKAMGAQGSLVDKEDRWQPAARWPHFYNYLRVAVRRRPDKRLHVFLDEYDAVIDLDAKRSARITWNLRDLYQRNSPEGIIQFVFAGSKQLARLAQNNQSDLYNFVDIEGCRLTNFGIGDVRTLLDRIQDLGVTIDEPALVAEELLHETAGRPASVQHVCYHVISQLRKQRKSTVTLALLRQIAQSPEYFQYYKGTLHENAETLENFILSLVSRQQFQNRSFSQEDVSGVLRDEFHQYIDPATLFRSLDDLVNSGFLILDPNYSGERYDIAVPVIKRIYRPLPAASYIPKLVEERVIQPYPR